MFPKYGNERLFHKTVVLEGTLPDRLINNSSIINFTYILPEDSLFIQYLKTSN